MNMTSPPSRAAPPGPTQIGSGLVRLVLALVILELTAATARIHLDLGGQLFTLNGFGYVALGGAYAIGALVPIPMVQRAAWLPRVGLALYALATIVAYLVIGPYFALGWITKGIELAIVGLLIADLILVYGDPRDIWGSVAGARGSR
jgi:hypothetical protein